MEQLADRTGELRALVATLRSAEDSGVRQRKTGGEKSTAAAVEATPSVYEQEARSVLADIESASALLSQAESRGAIAAAEIAGMENLLDVATGRVAVLQTHSEERAEQRRKAESRMAGAGLLSRFVGGSDAKPSHLDRHEAAIAWLLGHRVALLTRRLEALRARGDEKTRMQERIAALREAAVSSLRGKESTPASIIDDGPLPDESPAPLANLSAAQVQMLEKENDSLLKELQQTHAAVERSAATLSEIARLQGTLTEQLVFQAAQIDRLVDDAEVTADTLGRANEQLVRAAARQTTSARVIFWLLIFATFLVLLLHFAT